MLRWRDMQAVGRDSEGPIPWVPNAISVTSGIHIGASKWYTVRFAECDFLLVFYTDQTRIACTVSEILLPK